MSGRYSAWTSFSAIWGNQSEPQNSNSTLAGPSLLLPQTSPTGIKGEKVHLKLDTASPQLKGQQIKDTSASLKSVLLEQEK